MRKKRKKKLENPLKKIGIRFRGKKNKFLIAFFIDIRVFFLFFILVIDSVDETFFKDIYFLFSNLN